MTARDLKEILGDFDDDFEAVTCRYDIDMDGNPEGFLRYYYESTALIELQNEFPTDLPIPYPNPKFISECPDGFWGKSKIPLAK